MTSCFLYLGSLDLQPTPLYTVSPLGFTLTKICSASKTFNSHSLFFYHSLLCQLLQLVLFCVILILISQLFFSPCLFTLCCHLFLIQQRHTMVQDFYIFLASITSFALFFPSVTPHVGSVFLLFLHLQTAGCCWEKPQACRLVLCTCMVSSLSWALTAAPHSLFLVSSSSHSQSSCFRASPHSSSNTHSTPSSLTFTYCAFLFYKQKSLHKISTSFHYLSTLSPCHLSLPPCAPVTLEFVSFLLSNQSYHLCSATAQESLSICHPSLGSSAFLFIGFALSA